MKRDWEFRGSVFARFGTDDTFCHIDWCCDYFRFGSLDVLRRASALFVPNSQAVVGRGAHVFVFVGLKIAFDGYGVEAEVVSRRWSNMADDYVSIASRFEEPLDCGVGSVAVSDHDGESLVDNAIQ